jgi:hypothetical protein
MGRLQEDLERACRELDLILTRPFTAQLGGRPNPVFAHIADLGDRNGMLIVKSFDDFNYLGEFEVLCIFLEEAGYGFSQMDDNRDLYDVNTWISVFSDWGWRSKDKPRPHWMLSDKEIEKRDGEELDHILSQSS